MAAFIAARDDMRAQEARAALIEDLRSAWENAEDDGCDAHERAIWTREIRRIERELGVPINWQPDAIRCEG